MGDNEFINRNRSSVKWTVLSGGGLSFEVKLDGLNDSNWKSTFIFLKRPISYFWTIHFHIYGPSTIVLDWLKWPSSLTQDRSLLDGPSAFAQPSTLTPSSHINTFTHFHPVHFGPDSKKIFGLHIIALIALWKIMLSNTQMKQKNLRDYGSFYMSHISCSKSRCFGQLQGVIQSCYS